MDDFLHLDLEYGHPLLVHWYVLPVQIWHNLRHQLSQSPPQDCGDVQVRESACKKAPGMLKQAKLRTSYALTTVVMKTASANMVEDVVFCFVQSPLCFLLTAHILAFTKWSHLPWGMWCNCFCPLLLGWRIFFTMRNTSMLASLWAPCSILPHACPETSWSLPSWGSGWVLPLVPTKDKKLNSEVSAGYSNLKISSKGLS